MNKKVSLIVFWEKEELGKLTKCIQSIKKQIYKNYEVILLDCISSERGDFVKDFLTDKNFKYVSCEQGSSKFEKLKSVLKIARGEYVQFIDACDYLQCDWLYNCIWNVNRDADVIIGNQYYINKNGKLFYYNYSMGNYFEQGMFDKDELIHNYLFHGGTERYLTSLNNKIISVKTADTALKMCQKFTDLKSNFDVCYVFSVLWTSKVIINEKNSGYIYDVEKEAERYLETGSYEEYLQTRHNALLVIEELINSSSGEKIKNDWMEEWYIESYYQCGIYYPNDRKSIEKYLNKIAKKELVFRHDIGYFESAITELKDNSYGYFEKIKEFICSNMCEYVGFDVFDTLVQRPFWEPTDLFCLLNDKYNELVGKDTCIDFSLIRKEGEIACRGYYYNLQPSDEDVTIHEIYDYIVKFYELDKDIADKLKNYEIELELKYCQSRNIGKYLFDIAKYCGKKIIIASDMYLPIEVIKKILAKNGMAGYDKLYLSCEIGLSKYSGRLFEYILNDLKIKKPSSMCFIGDNYNSDVINSQKHGIIPYHVPKAKDMFMGLNNAIFSGNYFSKIYEPNGGIIDQGTVLKFLGIRCIMAVVANKIYGNPFVNFNLESDFNGNLEFIGYYCAGSFLFSEAKWLIDESKQRKINKIHFVSRDGFYVKKAFELLRGFFPQSAEANYLYFSRKAAASLYMVEKEGIYELFLPPHIMRQTPKNVVKMLSVVIKKDIDCKKVLLKNGVVWEKTFGSLHEYYRFAKVFVDELYDKNMAEANRDMLYEYFKQIIKPNEVICDVGYSGRMETAFTKLLGFPVGSFYFHEHEPWALMRKRTMKFNIKSFYAFKPCSAFVVREQLFTPNQPSCVGFERLEGKVIPVFDDYHAEFKETFILDVLQKSAICFVKDMTDIFGEDLQCLDFNYFDACIPFEFYLHYAGEFDRKALSAISFEDDFGSNEVMSMCDYWDKERKIYSLYLKDTPSENSSQPQVQPAPSVRIVVPEELKTLYADGEFVKVYNKMNKMFPLGSKRRNVVKKLASFFVR